MLFGGQPLPPDADPAAGAAWLSRDRARERMQVRVAVGMLMEQGHLTNPDALALLRGYAFSHEKTLDAVAADVADGKVPAEALIY